MPLADSEIWREIIYKGWSSFEVTGRGVFLFAAATFGLAGIASYIDNLEAVHTKKREEETRKKWPQEVHETDSDAGASSTSQTASGQPASPDEHEAQPPAPALPIVHIAVLAATAIAAICM